MIRVPSWVSTVDITNRSTNNEKNETSKLS